MGKLWEIMRRLWQSYGTLRGGYKEVTTSYGTTIGTLWEAMWELWEFMRTL